MHSDAPGLPPLFRHVDRIASYLDDGYAVLTPTRRLSRAVREADQQRRQRRGDVVWPSLMVTPITQFWTDQWQRAATAGNLLPRRLLDPGQQGLLWEQIIEGDSHAGFSLLNGSRAARLCQQADELLLLWRIDPHASPWSGWFRSGDDSRHFLRWRERFEARLRDLEATTTERAHAELLAQNGDGSEGDSRVFPPLLHLNCDTLTPLHAALAGLARDRVDLDAGSEPVRPQPVRAYQQREDELRAAARWCREQTEQDPGGRYAVVLQDMQGDRAIFETLLRREFGALTSDYDRLPVNFATGFPLVRAALIRDALRVLSLGCHEVDVEESIALLHSRFVSAGPLRRDRLETQSRRLRSLASERIPASVLRQLLAPLRGTDSDCAAWDLPLLLESRGMRLRGRRWPSAWTPVFQELLAVWRWGQDTALDSLEYQQRQQWGEVLDNFARLDDLYGTLNYEDSLRALRRLLGERAFQPQTTDRGMQVLGPLETSGLAFDGLLLTGMSAGTWPARARPNPYLPVALQRSERMPGADAATEAQTAEQRWNHWRRCTSQLDISFVYQSDESEQLASPLIADLEILRHAHETSVEPRWRQQMGAATVAVQETPVPFTDDVPPRISTGVLEAQAACPFQAFARSHLRTEPRPGPRPGLTPAERGTLLHHALHRLFERLPGSTALKDADAPQRRTAISSALEHAPLALHAERRMVLGAAVLELEKKRVAGLLEQWLELETQRGIEFTVLEQEVERELALRGVELRLRLDRIDRLADGSLIVIDYKSGRPESLDSWFTKPPTKPQLPLYALAEAESAGIAYAVLRPGELGWHGIGRQAFAPGIDPALDRLGDNPDDAELSPEQAFSTLQKQWRVALGELIDEYGTGAYPVEPVTGACRNCRRHNLCRIAELAVDEGIDS
ncbi:MAG: PD-(D/E)XK nuclease family protein [Pseudomonadota bacterium]